MPDGRPVRVSVEESDLQRLVKIFDRRYYSDTSAGNSSAIDTQRKAKG
jgi:hypothetical protein